MAYTHNYSPHFPLKVHNHHPISSSKLIIHDLLDLWQKTASIDGNESAVKSKYNIFFLPFLQNPEKLPTTNFPMGIFRAKNYSNIRYAHGYDFNWGRHNTNIQFTKSLKGNHSDFWHTKENFEVMAQSIDYFIQICCLSEGHDSLVSTPATTEKSPLP